MRSQTVGDMRLLLLRPMRSEPPKRAPEVFARDANSVQEFASGEISSSGNDLAS